MASSLMVPSANEFDAVTPRQAGGDGSPSWESAADRARRLIDEGLRQGMRKGKQKAAEAAARPPTHLRAEAERRLGAEGVSGAPAWLIELAEDELLEEEQRDACTYRESTREELEELDRASRRDEASV